MEIVVKVFWFFGLAAVGLIGWYVATALFDLYYRWHYADAMQAFREAMLKDAPPDESLPYLPERLKQEVIAEMILDIFSPNYDF